MSDNHSVKNYIIGFVLSLIPTLLAYFAVSDQISSGVFLLAVLLGLALAQVFVQLFFFMHLWQEKKPRLSLLVFLSTASVILIIVIGTIWINKNLSYHSQPIPSKSIIDDEGIKK